MEVYQNFRSTIIQRLEEGFDVYQQALEQGKPTKMDCLQLASEEKQNLLDVITSLRENAKIQAEERKALDAELLFLKDQVFKNDRNTSKSCPMEGQLIADTLDASNQSNRELGASDKCDGGRESGVGKANAALNISVLLERHLQTRESLQIQNNKYKNLEKDYQDLKRSYDLMRRSATAYKRAYQRAKDKLRKLQPAVEYQKACKLNWDRIFGPSNSSDHKLDISLSDPPLVSSVTTVQGANPSSGRAISSSELHSGTSLIPPAGNTRSFSQVVGMPTTPLKIEQKGTIDRCSDQPQSSAYGALRPDGFLKDANGIKKNDQPTEPSDKIVEELSVPQTAPSSTQSTDPDFKSQIAGHVDDSNPQSIISDSPIVIWERKVKRRRCNNGEDKTGPQDGSPERPYVIKKELYSSPIPPDSRSEIPGETLDLDEVVGTVETPRKQAYFQSLLSTAGHGKVLPVVLPDDEYLRHEGLVALPIIRDTDGELMTRTATLRHNRISSAPAKVSTVQLKSRPNQLMLPAETKSEVLQPLSVNRRDRTRSDIVRKRHRHNAGYATFIDQFAEDGEDIGPEDSSVTIQRGITTDAAKSTENPAQRIGALLDRHPPEVKPLRQPACLITPHRPVVGDKSKSAPDIARSKLFDDGNHPDNPLHSNRVKSLKNLHARKSLEPTETVRKRPLQQLGLTDFKINPKRNHGLNYAFSEVVRGFEHRRCLPNCTRQECCGDKFHKMIEIGGALEVPRGLWDSSQEDDDERLLKAFLGDDYGNVQRMTKEEKLATLDRARSQKLAITHGKHKMLHQRSSTPPGFWRTDFPTTQELKQDKAAAEEMERRQVKERYEEAMRPNGLWQFRDE